MNDNERTKDRKIANLRGTSSVRRARTRLRSVLAPIITHEMAKALNPNKNHSTTTRLPCV